MNPAAMAMVMFLSSVAGAIVVVAVFVYWLLPKLRDGKGGR